MHRLRWNMNHAGAWSPSASQSGGGGPRIAPGTYQVRLTAAGVTQTRTLRVRIDPRLAEKGVSRGDLEETLGLNLRIRDAHSQSRLVLARIQRAEQALEGETGEQAERARRALAELKPRIQTDPNEPSYPQPMLIDQINYLYGMTNAADQKLGRDAFERYGQLRSELDRYLAALRTILDNCGALCD
jgi:hypothetical protein